MIEHQQLESWCKRFLGATPVHVLFQTGHLSQVFGLRLADGREVVVKLRPAADRLSACTQVQRHLWMAGFPCPEPLADPTTVDGVSITAEALVPGGTDLEPYGDSPHLIAEALARLVSLAPDVDALPTLSPPPAWVWWNHGQQGPWPVPDDLDLDLNSFREPAWLDDAAHQVRARLARFRSPPVVGHSDWERHNLRWNCRTLHVVHDWDSVVAQPEATIAGAAAAVFRSSDQPTLATLGETEEFLKAYEKARGHPWSADEWEACWAAGLWISAFNAKKETLRGGATPTLDRLSSEVGERLALGGA